MYVFGVTVYDFSHVGKLKEAVGENWDMEEREEVNDNRSTLFY